MDKFPLLWKEAPLGELTTEREALYTWFTARCRLPGKGLWCAWAVGDRGELRLGILEPEGERAADRRVGARGRLGGYPTAVFRPHDGAVGGVAAGRASACFR